MVDRDGHRITLDPAVRVGTPLAEFGSNALLLHTTSWGHCQETAAVLARHLRASGWTVSIRDFDELEPIRDNVTDQPGLLDRDVLAALCASIGPAPGANYMPPVPTRPRTLPKRSSKTRMRCRVCLHLTVGRGVNSHVQNVGHDEWERVLVQPDGKVCSAQSEELPP